MKRAGRLTALLLALCMITALTGCVQEEKELLTVRAALTGAPATLDPAMLTTATERTVGYHVFENLMKLTSGGAVCAQAASYVCTDNLDGTETYTFKLRSDIYWSDGQPVTAGDYVYAWRRLVNPETGSPHSEILNMVAGYEEAVAVEPDDDSTEETEAVPSPLQITAVDSRTLEIRLNSHCAYFLSAVCTSVYTMPVRSDAVERGADWAVRKTTLLTNGAYTIDTWDDTAMTLTETEKYYDTKRLGPEVLDFTFTDTDEAALALYESGEADFTVSGAALAEQEGTVAMGCPTTGVLLINQMAAGLRENTRLALSLSIDRVALSTALSGDYVAAEGLVPAGIQTCMGGSFRQENGPLVDNDPEGYAQRCSEAQEQLRSTLGDRLDYSTVGALGMVTLLYESSMPYARAAAQLRDMWQERLGVRVTLVSAAAEEMQQKLSEGDFTMALVQLTSDRNDAAGYLENFTGEAEKNYCQYYANAYDMLLRAAGNAGISEARDAYLKDAERLLVESGYAIPLYTMERYRLLREPLCGVIDDGMGGCIFNNVVKLAEG